MLGEVRMAGGIRAGKRHRERTWLGSLGCPRGLEGRNSACHLQASRWVGRAQQGFSPPTCRVLAPLSWKGSTAGRWEQGFSTADSAADTVWTRGRGRPGAGAGQRDLCTQCGQGFRVCPIRYVGVLVGPGRRGGASPTRKGPGFAGRGNRPQGRGLQRSCCVRATPSGEQPIEAVAPPPRRGRGLRTWLVERPQSKIRKARGSEPLLDLCTSHLAQGQAANCSGECWSRKGGEATVHGVGIHY